MLKMKLNYRYRSDRVRFVMKIKRDSSVSDGIGAIYAENDTKWLRLIELGMVFDESQTRQRHDRYASVVYAKNYIENSGPIG